MSEAQKSFLSVVTPYVKKYSTPAISSTLGVAGVVSPIGASLFLLCASIILYRRLASEIKENAVRKHIYPIRQQMVRIEKLVREAGVSVDVMLGQSSAKILFGPWAGTPSVITPARDEQKSVEEKLQEEHQGRYSRRAPFLFAMSLVTAIGAFVPLAITVGAQRWHTVTAYNIAKNAASNEILNGGQLSSGTKTHATSVYKQDSFWMWDANFSANVGADARITNHKGNYLTIQFDDGTSQKYHIKKEASHPPQGYSSGVIEFVPGGTN